jgi:hypothetical protein
MKNPLIQIVPTLSKEELRSVNLFCENNVYRTVGQGKIALVELKKLLTQLRGSFLSMNYNVNQ